VRRGFHVTLALRESRDALGSGLALSLLSHLTTILAAWLIALALHVHVGIGHFFVYVPLIVVLSMIPVSINGIGLRESGYVFFFTKVGVSAESAMAMSLVFLALTLVLGMVGGVVWVLRGRHPVPEAERTWAKSDPGRESAPKGGVSCESL